MAYAVPQELRNYIGKTSSVGGSTLTTILEAAERNINRACNRPDGFTASNTATARLYAGSGDDTLKELFDYRFGNLVERLDRLADAFDKLSAAIITRAAFDELARDVKATDSRLNEAEGKIRDLEERVRFGKYLVVGLMVLVSLINPLAIDKISQLF